MPLSNSVMKVSAVFSSSSFIAFTGQTNVHAPQPSQRNGFIVKFSMALNLQTPSHLPHLIQIPSFIDAFFPPTNLTFSISFPL